MTDAYPAEDAKTKDRIHPRGIGLAGASITIGLLQHFKIWSFQDYGFLTDSLILVGVFVLSSQIMNALWPTKESPQDEKPQELLAPSLTARTLRILTYFSAVPLALVVVDFTTPKNDPSWNKGPYDNPQFIHSVIQGFTPAFLPEWSWVLWMPTLIMIRLGIRVYRLRT